MSGPPFFYGVIASEAKQTKQTGVIATGGIA